MQICGRILVLRVISYAQVARERKPVFFSKLTYHTNYSYWICNI